MTSPNIPFSLGGRGYFPRVNNFKVNFDRQTLQISSIPEVPGVLPGTSDVCDEMPLVSS